MKKIVVSITLILSMMLFAGCDYNGNKIYDALVKASEINSYEMDTEVSMSFDSQGFSEEEKMSLDIVKAMLNNSSFKMHNKISQNEEKTNLDNYADIYMNYGGLGFGMELWQNLSQDDSKFVQIMKVPSILMMSMNEFSGKEYLVMEDEDFGFLGSNASLKQIQDKANEIMKKFIAQYDPDMKLIDFKNSEVVDGESVYNYVLSLDNESLVKLLKYTVNNVLDYEDGMDDFKEFFGQIIEMVQVPGDEIEDAKDEINEAFDMFVDNKEEIKEKANEVLDLLEECEILGEEGIQIEYSLNKEGYIINKSGTIDLNLNLNKIEKAVTKIVGTEFDLYNENIVKDQSTKVIELGIKFNSKIYNINEKIDIEMPELTEENSIKLDEMTNYYDEIDTVNYNDELF
ncbi:hypothetical protein SH1V18_46960 [Vallitalea longa]|uniref:Lipoprotein n=1 Tax=Vallitalea longa TaxID=2936439 RepID=A0A9W5YG67_9FIRM|nr:hypothetical protein [Vallitalea longa]GKX32216.1 hypothetical protein SH1V18_46960 [Vallitalea longa]